MRDVVLRQVAAMVPEASDAFVFVGIDGVDGAGKTTFADELAEVLRADARPTIRVSMDGFHHVRAHRYRQGATSPVGFYEDSFDYEAFERNVLHPLSPGGSGHYLAAVHDVRTDEVLSGPELTADPSIVVVDGLFLHRPRVRDYWDFSVLLDVDFSVSVQRMAERDGSDPDPAAESNRRYVEGQRIYFAACNPRRLADVVVENNDLSAPKCATPRSGPGLPIA